MSDIEAALAAWERRALTMPKHPPAGYLLAETVRLEQAVAVEARVRGVSTLTLRRTIAERRRDGATLTEAATA